MLRLSRALPLYASALAMVAASALPATANTGVAYHNRLPPAVEAPLTAAASQSDTYFLSTFETLIQVHPEKAHDIVIAARERRPDLTPQINTIAGITEPDALAPRQPQVEETVIPGGAIIALGGVTLAVVGVASLIDESDSVDDDNESIRGDDAGSIFPSKGGDGDGGTGGGDDDEDPVAEDPDGGNATDPLAFTDGGSLGTAFGGRNLYGARNLVTGGLSLGDRLDGFGQGTQVLEIAPGRSLSIGAGPDADPRLTALNPGRVGAGRAGVSMSLTDNTTGLGELSFAANRAAGRSFGLAEGAGIDAGDMATRDAFQAPWLNFSDSADTATLGRELGGGLSVRVGASSGSDSDDAERTSGAAMAEVSQQLGAARMAVQFGSVRETGTVLGGAADGFFDTDRDTATTFVGTSASFDLGAGWTALGAAQFGLTDARIEKGGALSAAGDILSSSFSLGLVGSDTFRTDDRLGFVVSQPLRVERADAKLAGSGGEAVSLAADGREVDVEAFYAMTVGEGSSLASSVMLRTEPDNDAEAAPEGLLLMRLKQAF